MDKRRVVISGVGMVTSIGIGKDAFWNAIMLGTSGISNVTMFDTTEFRCHKAGEIKNFDVDKFIPQRRNKFLGRTSQLAITAAGLAIKDSKLDIRAIQSNRLGVFLGTTMGEKPMEESITTWHRDGLSEIKKMKIVQSSANNISSNVAIYYHANGLNYMFSTACSAGNYSIGYGFDSIRTGELDYAFVGGADSFSKSNFSGFHRLYAMAPEKVQPFDKNRKGIIVGEGAGVLIIETLESALTRKADIYAEIIGYGLSCDAHHITAPYEEGVAKAMAKALNAAGISPKDVDYINAHGTGTPANDKTECAAIKKVFGETIPPISSTKSMLGHTMGAASAIESITTCLAIKKGILPPTINYETPDPNCNIDCVPNTSRPKEINIAMKNGFAFGGNNACVVFKQFLYK